MDRHSNPLSKVKAAWNLFQVESGLGDAAAYGTGHIHQTFLTASANASPQRYIFQLINENVFKNPEAMMANILRVTQHLAQKLQDQGIADWQRRVLQIVPALDGRPFARDAAGNFWRVYRYIENAQTFETIQNPAQARAAARAFGEFVRLLADLPGEPLQETIPDFHHTGKRCAALEAAIGKDPLNRAILAGPEIGFALNQARQANSLTRQQAAGRLPTRTIHNDTKINNLLVDPKTGQGLCVTDVDTTMPGLALYDFGDMVRTGAASSPEDERDLQKVHIQLPLFASLVEGYLEGAAQILTPEEIAQLSFAARLMTFENGVRFLTDFLLGDIYFHIHRPQHNLERTRAQFKLVQSMELLQEEMERIVGKILEANQTKAE